MARALHSCPIVLLIVCMAGFQPVLGAQAANPVVNPSFEEAQDGRPVGWRPDTWAGRAEFEYVDGGRTGQKCVLVHSTQGADASWQTTVPVLANSRYRLTGYIKTEALEVTTGRGAQFNLHNIQSARSRAIRGTNDWTKIEMEFETEGETEVILNCLLGGWGLATGKAWFDDVAMELLSTRTVEPKLEIDAARMGEPVSVYIYGQFIEHLGRCIYGGIWAEMLEDRKFYYEPGRRGSPWKLMGEASALSMDTETPYVGDHTPQWTLTGAEAGLVQGGLGIVEGKAYVGRIVITGAASDNGRTFNLSRILGVKGLGPVSISLVWGDGPQQRQTVSIKTVKGAWTTVPLSFTAGATTDDARLEIVGRGTGVLKIAAVSLMPADNIKGMRADTLALLKELNAPIYRWPGGNFVSGYEWRDGIGDPDRRPPRRNPAWQGIEHNDFGLDEFIAFCREIGTEPMIAVNTGFGDDFCGAQEVEYANGSPDTPMGKWRAKNGHREPYAVTWWCIGNEMYGNWQLGYMALNHYVIKHNRFAKAMRAVDPTIKLIGSGDAGSWSEGMLRNCADTMDLISEHWYVQERRDVPAHVRQTVTATRGKAEAHRRYRQEIPQIRDKDIRIALDEWNYWSGPHVFGELGTRYFHKDGLGIAAGLNEMIRNSDLFFMANYAQTVNVIGCIKTTKTAAAFETTGLPLKLYREHFGVIPVAIETDTYPLDAVAAWTEDRMAMTIAVVNPTDKEQTLPITVKGTQLAGTGTLWLIAHEDPMVYNEPGVEPRVVIKESQVTTVGDALILPPYSTSLYRLAVR